MIERRKETMNKAIQRDHLPIGSEPIYDKIVDRLLLESPILNEKTRAKDHSLAFINFSDPRELNRLLATIKIEKSTIETSIKEQAKRWQQQQSKKVDEGMVAPKSKYEPNEEERKKNLRFQSQLYVVSKEIEYLNKLLSKSEETVTKVADKNVLRNGVRGVGQIRNGSLILIDFQPVVKAKDGCLIIACEESPFHLVSTFDYITLVKKYGVVQTKIEGQQQLMAQKLTAAGIDKEAIKTETDKLKARLLKENPELDLPMIKWRGKTLPDPQGIKKHELNDKQMIRTKIK